MLCGLAPPIECRKYKSQVRDSLWEVMYNKQNLVGHKNVMNCKLLG